MRIGTDMEKPHASRDAWGCVACAGLSERKRSSRLAGKRAGHYYQLAHLLSNRSGPQSADYRDRLVGGS